MLKVLKRLYAWLYNYYIHYRARKIKGWQLFSSKRLELRLLLNCSNFIDFIIRENGCFEEEVLVAIDLYSSDKKFLFIDAGSQLGQFSLYVKKRYPSAGILSFEPNLAAYHQQQVNMLINDLDYQLVPKALSLQTGTASFFTPSEHYTDGYGKRNPGIGSLVNEPQSLAFGSTVETVMLDCYRNTWIDYENILIKIDVEGAEWMVLEGGRELMTSGKKICLIVELFSESHPENVGRVKMLLKDWGFRRCDKEWQVQAEDEYEKQSGNYFYKR
ncbi:FkbM family methyltransferase [Cesiribacter sp. SM1]|uniref:FkbM family methyltransferase n=1 Tax=Cesiribacter sp. SM1 TaxID=2861196 RepID=UPI001CD2255D|nr:FkbM family methyltransferase [Cesiribacter sp. SM1]